MKILFIDVNCKNSSTGNIVYELYKKCIEAGYHAAICYGRGSRISEKNIYKFGLDIETYFHALMTRLIGLTGCFSYFSTKRLIKYIKKYNPDIVHIHELHAYFVNIRQLLNYLNHNNIKLVWSFHCEFMYTGKCGHAYECTNWQDACGSCPALHSYPSTLFFDFTKHMLKEKKRLLLPYTNLIIVTPSKWLANRVKKSFLKDKPLKIVHNGINQHVFKPTDFMELKKKHDLKHEKVILTVAPDVLSESKGGYWVLKLAEQMINYKFIIIGIDKSSGNFSQNVIPIGRISDASLLAKYYSLADVFLICSKRENFPTTCIEALSCGTPIVGFNTGGTAETAPNGLGLFSDYGNIEKLKENIIEIINESENLKPRCINYARKNYTLDAMFDGYDEIYKTKFWG